jgi:hypothetical protein
LSEWDVAYKYRSDIGPRVEGDTPLYDKNGFNYDKALNRKRIVEGLKLLVSELNDNDNVAIMATKKEPLECHRFLVLSRVLQNMGYTIKHILPEETVGSEVIEKRLLDTLQRRIKRGTVEAPENYDPLEFAYYAQAEKIAKVGMKKYKVLKGKNVV